MTITNWIKRLAARVEAGSSGYLEQMGWMQTRAERRARDRKGSPIPWFTYPAIALLDDRVKDDWRILEFGAGMGTLWWCRHAREVVSIEHHAGWAADISSQCGVSLIAVSDSSAESYVSPSLGRELFDVVIVVGIYREECLAAAPALLTPRGIIILDDAQRSEYRPAVDRLKAIGFRTLPLHGPQPVSKHPGCTEMIYRDNNVLGI